jgi:hypothetical protein
MTIFDDILNKLDEKIVSCLLVVLFFKLASYHAITSKTMEYFFVVGLLK